MYADDLHESIIPVNNGVRVWRYIDLPRFVSMLESKSLFFSRLDSLGDPLEGRLTAKNVERMRSYGEDTVERSFYHLIESARTTFFVSCWHMGDRESAGMWSAYAGLDRGIAITTTTDRLKNAFALEKRPIRMSKIKYIDRRVGEIFIGNVFNFALSKGAYYSFENELRVFHWLPDGKGAEDGGEVIPSHGIPIRIDIDTLVEKVVVSPFAPQWFFDVVRSLCYAYNLRSLADKVAYSEMKEETFI